MAQAFLGGGMCSNYHNTNIFYRNVTFIDNTAIYQGGAALLINHLDDSYFLSSNFINNVAGDAGGSIFMSKPFGVRLKLSLKIENCVFQFSSA